MMMTTLSRGHAMKGVNVKSLPSSVGKLRCGSSSRQNTRVRSVNRHVNHGTEPDSSRGSRRTFLKLGLSGGHFTYVLITIRIFLGTLLTLLGIHDAALFTLTTLPSEGAKADDLPLNLQNILSQPPSVPSLPFLQPPAQATPPQQPTATQSNQAASTNASSSQATGTTTAAQPSSSQSQAKPSSDAAASTSSSPATPSQTPAPSNASPAPMDDITLTDEAAKRLLAEEEEKRKQRRRKKGRIRELEEVGLSQ